MGGILERMQIFSLAEDFAHLSIQEIHDPRLQVMLVGLVQTIISEWPNE